MEEADNAQKELDGDVQAEVRLPVWDSGSGMVAVCLGSGNYQHFGSMTIIRPKEPTESKAIYCSLHGCKKCIRSSKLPHTTRVMEWFKAGEALPRSTKEEKDNSQVKHLAMWDNIVNPVTVS